MGVLCSVHPVLALFPFVLPELRSTVDLGSVGRDVGIAEQCVCESLEDEARLNVI
jgi:hypothetical protein